MAFHRQQQVLGFTHTDSFLTRGIRREIKREEKDKEGKEEGEEGRGRRERERRRVRALYMVRMPKEERRR